MNVNLGLWGKLTRLVVFLLLLAAFLGVALWYWPLIQQNERMRKRILELETQIQKEEEIARQQKTSIDAMRTDPKTVERLARETLGYAKPGEIVIRFEPSPTNNPVKR
ncbi:MAG: septum formation initiator family protein [Verrucomicrobia bacterium]|nr:septum formation initiator family protein [Verrucomicrobiota bacterium]